MIDKRELRKLSRQLKCEPQNYMKSLRENLLMYIGHKGITLTELADKSDISINTLKSLVYGYSDDCHLSTVVSLSKALCVSVDELVGCGSLSPQTCESLQIVRLLPESFTHFVRWAIHYHYDMLNSAKVSEKSVQLMVAETADNGNLKMTNNFDVIDISEFSDDIRPKIFMGIQIPCMNYLPKYMQGDVLFIANDRDARPDEDVVVCISDNMWILRRRIDFVDGKSEVAYYSIRDNRLFARENEIQLVLGYIVKVKRFESEVM